MTKLRDYQQAAVDSLLDYWERPDDRVEIGAFGRSQPKVAYAEGERVCKPREEPT